MYHYCQGICIEELISFSWSIKSLVMCSCDVYHCCHGICVEELISFSCSQYYFLYILFKICLVWHIGTCSKLLSHLMSAFVGLPPKKSVCLCRLVWFLSGSWGEGTESEHKPCYLQRLVKAERNLSILVLLSLLLSCFC